MTKKAVVIDDDPTIRLLLGTVLENKGFEVKSYASAASCPIFDNANCPCSLDGTCPEIIVSDFDMPLVNGLQFVEHLKHVQCKCENIAIISGYWDEWDLRQQLPTGVSFFAKPFHIKGFSSWVDRVLGQKRSIANQENRRASMRQPCSLPVDVFVSSPGLLELLRGMAQNISAGGMLLECNKFISPDAKCQLAFTAPGWLKPGGGVDGNVMVSACARHVDRTAGLYGMQFLDAVA